MLAPMLPRNFHVHSARGGVARRHPLGANRDVMLPFAGIMIGAAGGSAMWLVAALIVWAVSH